MDSLEVYVMPILLGDGIPLFPKEEKQIRLKKLTASVIKDTIIKQVYTF